jgi:succinoglycan biosynthesis transport protein ExoP
MPNCDSNSDFLLIKGVPGGRGAVSRYGTPSYDDGREQSQLLEYWRLLRMRIRSVLALGGVGLAAGFLITMLQTPMYRARTSLDIQALNSDVLKIAPGTQTEGDQHPAESYIQTEIRILQSNFMMNRAIGRLKTQRPKEAMSQPPAWRKAIGLGATGINWDDLVQETARRVKVRSLGLTRMVEVVCDSRDPRLAGQFCNVLAQEYIAQNLEARSQTTQNTSEWLSQQLEALKRRLAKSEGELQEAARLSALVYAADRDTLAQEKLRELQNELARAQAERVSKQSMFEMISSNTPESLPMVSDNPYIREYTVRLEELRRQFAEASSIYAPAHYKIRQLQLQIDQIRASIDKQRADILARIRTEFEAAQRREGLLTAAYQGQMTLVAEQAGKGVQYNMLKREVDSTRKIYETMLQRIEELSLASAMRASTIRVVDPAMRPTVPYTPNWGMNCAGGLFAGLFGGMMLAVIASRSERTLRVPGQTSIHLEIRELGVIPSRKRSGMRRLLTMAPAALGRRDDAIQQGPEPLRLDGNLSESGRRSRQSDRLELESWYKKYSILSESFSAAMNSILLSAEHPRKPKTILITSPEGGDGKTTVCSNLAIALAKIDLRVLLIDGDTRRPHLHEAFGIPNEDGLIEILSSRMPLEEIPSDSLARATCVPRLSLMPPGNFRRFEPALLHSSRAAALLTRLRSEFDVVLIDSPPMLQFSDARVLGHLVDGVILVFRAGKTTVDLAVALRNCFMDDGSTVIGTILNDWDPRHSKTYGNYYRNHKQYISGSQMTA